MVRTLALTGGSALFMTALLLGDSPRKKDVIEPPPPEKPKVEPVKTVKETAPVKPKLEPPKIAKEAPAAPAQPRAKPVIKQSPFASPEPSTLEKLASAKKLASEKKADDKPQAKKPAVSKPKAARKAAAAGYVHAVVIPLKKDAPSGTADRMVADCHTMLAKIPSVRAVKAGRPAEKHSPEFVKKDYSVGLVVLVDDHEGLTAYLDHALHLEFVEKYKKYIDFEHLHVFDFVNGK